MSDDLLKNFFAKGKVKAFQNEGEDLSKTAKRVAFSRFSDFLSKPVKNISGNDEFINTCKQIAKEMGIEIKFSPNNMQNIISKGQER